MKTKLALATLFLATVLVPGLAAQPRVGIGISFGPGYYPPPPPARYMMVPPRPAPGLVWVNGYWYPGPDRYYWRTGAWVRPPHARSRWVAPGFSRGNYYRGYWR